MIKTNKKINLLHLTWPIFIETFLRLFFGNVDTFMLSKFSDKAVAAVGVITQISFFITLFYLVISSGTSIIISQNLGAKNNERAQDTALVALITNIILGIILSLTIFFSTEIIVGFFNLEQEVRTFALQYLRVFGAFSFTIGIGVTLTAVLRSYGNSKEPMYVNILANFLNIMGNYIAIFGPFGLPVLGVSGVALSTMASHGISAIVMYRLMKKRGIRLDFKKLFKLPISMLHDILKIGIPSAGEGIAYNTSQIAITIMIATLGTAAITAKVYSFNIMYFVMISSISIGQGLQILTGQLVGANEHHKAYNTCLKTLRLSLAITLFLAVLIAINGERLIKIFTSDPEIIKLSSKLLLLTIILEPGRTFNLVVINALKGAGDVKFPVFMGIMSMWGNGVVLSYIFIFYLKLGLVGIWVAYSIDEWFRGITMLRRWRSMVWKEKSLVKQS